ncbi:MAG: type II secretion system protein GspG [Polyangiaceae bacterium]|nr:type II secretion system protein GspG [Polyangiaceae bacterium]
MAPVRAPRRRAVAARGVTLFEVGAVGSLLACSVLGYVLLIAPPNRSDKLEAATRIGDRLGDAVTTWRSDNGDACPTVSQLIHEGYLDPQQTAEDPWGGRFRVHCRDGRVDVTSPGRDGDLGTGDDVVVRAR